MLRWFLDLFKSAEQQQSSGKHSKSAVDAETALPPPFLRRESILDRSQQVAAYIFSAETPAAMHAHTWHAASRKLFDSVLIDHFASDKLASALGKRLAFLPLGPEGLHHPRLELLPKHNLVIEFDPPAGAEFDLATTLERLIALKGIGFKLACGHSLAERGLSKALEVADYISLGDVASQDPPDLLARCRNLTSRYPKGHLLARNIDSTELYQACQKMGIELFQGSFLTHRTPSTTNKTTPYRVFVVELLNAIKRQVDYGDLAGIAWRDPILAYRLLRFVNSAAFGLRVKIDRLRHAMAYVGRDELYRWLTLLLFSNKVHNPLDDALRENALVRARLAEKLAEGRMSRKECDEVFVVGILSVIDALMQMTMQDALAQLSLPEDVADALLRQEGKYAPYLKLAIACEEDDQDRIRALAIDCDIDATLVNQRHIDALVWTMSFNESLEDSMMAPE
jgi:c-di-GMP phosphodiesterase